MTSSSESLPLFTLPITPIPSLTNHSGSFQFLMADSKPNTAAAPERENAEKDNQIKALKAEIERLRDAEAELRNVAEERETRVENLEREAKELRQGNTEKEMKVRELERMLGVVQMTEVEERSKRVRAEEEMREKVDEKDREIEGLIQQIEELEEKVRVLELKMKESENCEVNLQWPVVVAGSSGAVVAVAALIHFCFRKRRS